MSKPRTFSELYPSQWLKSDDLKGQVAAVTVESVEVQEFNRPREGRVSAAVLSFVGKKKRLILNKTQARRMVELTGTEAFEAWVGVRVALRGGMAHNHKPTIVIEPFEEA